MYQQSLDVFQLEDENKKLNDENKRLRELIRRFFTAKGTKEFFQVQDDMKKFYETEM